MINVFRRLLMSQRPLSTATTHCPTAHSVLSEPFRPSPGPVRHKVIVLESDCCLKLPLRLDLLIDPYETNRESLRASTCKLKSEAQSRFYRHDLAGFACGASTFLSDPVVIFEYSMVYCKRENFLFPGLGLDSHRLPA